MQRKLPASPRTVRLLDGREQQRFPIHYGEFVAELVARRHPGTGEITLALKRAPKERST